MPTKRKKNIYIVRKSQKKKSKNWKMKINKIN